MDGLFITFEGVDGTGKGTQIQLLQQQLQQCNISTVCTREPGGTPFGDEIRAYLLSNQSEIDPVTEVYLFALSRARHVREVIRPGLQSGKVVLCDRYLDSSVAYQGYGREVGEQAVLEANRLAVDDVMPDITFLFDTDITLSLSRLSTEKDRIEASGSEFFQRVRQGYLACASKNTARIVLVDASLPIADIQRIIWKIIKDRLHFS